MKRVDEINHKIELQLKALQNITDNIGAYIFAKDCNGKYTYVNNLVRDLFNYPIDEIIGYDDSKFFSIELSNDIMNNDRLVLEEGRIVESEEKNIIKETGEIKFYMSVKKPLYDDKGNIIGMFGISTDITERKRLENELQEKTQLLNTILNNVDAHIYMKDDQYKYRYINPKLEKLFGLKASDVIGKLDSEIMPIELAEKFHDLDKKVFETEKTHSNEECFINNEGQSSFYWSIKVPLKNLDGKIDSFVGFSTDITELTHLRQKLQQQVEKETAERKKQEQLAITDKLTQLHNRLKIDETIEYELRRMKRSKNKFSIILLDIDNFKKINDTYGHQIGDEVLITISQILKKHSRLTDVIGRWGGEEFMIICAETDANGVKNLAQNLCNTINDNSFNMVNNVTASFGVTTYTENDNNDTIIKRADLALYKAKKNGKNSVETE